MNLAKDFGKQWYKMSVDDALAFLAVDKNTGVSNKEIQQRSKKFGTNTNKNDPKSFGYYKVHVLRDSRRQVVGAKNLVIGDIVYLAAGDIVPADLRVMGVNGVRVQEDSVTGNSAMVNKTTHAIRESTPVNAHKNILFKGTVIVDGTATGVAIRVGADCQAAGYPPKLKRRRLSIFTKKKINSLAKKGIYVQEPDIVGELGSVDTILVNLPLNADSVKEAIRVLDVGLRKNLIFVTDEPTYLKWISEIPGILFINKNSFDTKSNKSLLEGDHPILALIDIGQEDILRYVKLLKIKSRQILWVDIGRDSQLSSAAAISVIVADNARPSAVAGADIFIPTANNNEWIRKIENII